MGYELAPDDNGNFENEVLVFMAAVLKEALWSLWDIVLSGRGNGPTIFDSYVRRIFAGPSGTTVSLDVRKRFDRIGNKVLGRFPFPCCQEIEVVVDLFPTILNADSKSLVLYYVSEASRQGLGSGYKDATTKRVYAIRTTTEIPHEANPSQIAQIFEQVVTMGNDWQLYVLFVVPSANFHGFKTKPPTPVRLTK
jgi:hypothetical protein